MKVLDMEQSRSIHAGHAQIHRHWACLGLGIGKKMYISKPYYSIKDGEVALDAEKHTNRYRNHNKLCVIYTCSKNCR